MINRPVAQFAGYRLRPLTALSVGRTPASGNKQALLQAGLCVLLYCSLGMRLFSAELVVENLGSVERTAFVRGHAMSPGTKDYPPRLLIGCTDGDGTWIVNLHDGTARRAESAGFEDDHLQWPSLIGSDGKVFTSCGRGGLAVFDPVADTMKLIRPIPDAWWLRGLAIGPDGAVYVSDYPTGAAAKYDPRTGKSTHLGRQGGPFTISHIYGYSVGCDGRYVYTATGKIPWYVTAFDTLTGQQKNLFRFESPDEPEVHQRGDKVFLEVQLGSSPAGKPASRHFRLADGRAEPVDAVPRFDDSYVPGNDRPQPEIEPWGRNLPITENGAAIRYRLPGQAWRTTYLPVAGKDMTIERIAPLSDGRLLVSAGPYGNVHIFDPRTRSFTRLGNPASKNVYDMLEADGRIYFCGYPNGIFGDFGSEGGKLIGNWHDEIGSKHALFLVKGADGRIYSGNHNERESTGGALGWYDPQSGRFGGLRFPNDDCEWMTSAMNGRFIIYASDFSDDPTHPEIKKRNGQLLIYDTEQQKIVRKVSPLSGGSAGVVVETAPGVLFGLGLHDKLPVMYTIEVATGEVGERIALSAAAYRTIARGPDGKVYFFIKNVLMRADPKSLELESLCPASPGRMVFLENDLYIAETSQLRRVAKVAGRPPR